jgi:hypothetical protein
MSRAKNLRELAILVETRRTHVHPFYGDLRDEYEKHERSVLLGIEDWIVQDAADALAQIRAATVSERPLEDE